MADAKTVKAVVLVHAYAYHEKSGDPSTPRVDVDPPDGATSTKGVEIEVSQDEFDRAQKMQPPALAKAGSKEAKLALDPEAQKLPPGKPLDGLSDSDIEAVATARGIQTEGKTRDELVGLLVDAPKP